MPTEQQVLDRQHQVTDRISAQVRTLAVSFLAVVWLFLIGEDGSPVLSHPPEQSLLFGAGGTALIAMVLDFLQYVAGYQVVQHALVNPEQGEYSYNLKTFAYRAQSWLFTTKQLFLAASFGFLVVAFAEALSGC